MKIALVTPHASPPGFDATSAGGPRVIPLAKALAQLGHAVTVYARKDAPSLPDSVAVAPRVVIEHVPAGPAKRLPADDVAPHAGVFGDGLARRWRHDPPDVAHAYSWPSGLAALVGARDLGVPIVQTFQALASPAPGRGLRQSRESLARIRLKVCLARSVQAVLARSSAEMRELAKLGVPRDSIRVAPWGVDTGFFSPQGPVAQRNGHPRLLAIGSLAEQQWDEIVIRALAGVPGAELVMAGERYSAQPRGGESSLALTRLAKKLKVADRVSFAGRVGWQELPALLRSADLLVGTAWDSLFDASLLQAMACGTPAAAPAVGFYSDVITDGTNGLLVPPGQPAVLARRIRQLLASPMQLDAFGVAAVDRARSRYSWDRVARETLQSYERCLPRSAPEPVEDVDPDLDLELADSL